MFRTGRTPRVIGQSVIRELVPFVAAVRIPARTCPLISERSNSVRLRDQFDWAVVHSTIAKSPLTYSYYRDIVFGGTLKRSIITIVRNLYRWHRLFLECDPTHAANVAIHWT